MPATQSLKTFIKRISWLLLVWIIATCLFGLIRAWGVESLPAYERVLPFDPIKFGIQLLVLSLAIGIPFGLMDYFLNADWLSKRSYWLIILVKGFIQFFIALFSISTLVFISNWLYFESELNFLRGVTLGRRLNSEKIKQ